MEQITPISYRDTPITLSGITHQTDGVNRKKHFQIHFLFDILLVNKEKKKGLRTLVGWIK